MAYGVPIRGPDDFAEAERKARARHDHYYADAPGWCYRAESVSYAAIQPYADPVSGDGKWYKTDPVIEIFAYPVVRWTPCGATIRDIWGRNTETRFTDLRPNAKTFASRTARDAISALMRRRESQVYALNKIMGGAKRDITLCSDTLAPCTLLVLAR